MTDAPRPRVRMRRFGNDARDLERGLAQRPQDTMDRAINDAAETGTIAMEEAFPEPPAPVDPDEISYEREYQLRLLHRLLMRNLPIDLIAEELQLTPRSVWRMRAELNRRLANEVKNIDTFAFFGRTMSFYDEVRGLALRNASNDKTPIAAKAAHLSVAIAAEQAKTRFLDHAGFFDHNRFIPPKRELTDAVEDGRKKLGTIFNAVRAIMDGEDSTRHYAVPDTPQEGDSDDGVSVL